MYGGETDWRSIIALHVQESILLAGNVSYAGILAWPDQKHDSLSLALYVFGSRHPKVKISFQLLFCCFEVGTNERKKERI